MACLLSFAFGIIVGVGGLLLWCAVEYVKQHPDKLEDED